MKNTYMKEEDTRRFNGKTDFARREMEQIAAIFGKDAKEIFFAA